MIFSFSPPFLFLFSCGFDFRAGLSSWTFTVPATHLSHHGPASAMQPHASGMLVGAWSAPPSAGVAGGPHITSSGPPGDAGPPVQGVAGKSGNQGTVLPSGRSSLGWHSSSQWRDMGAGPSAGLFPSDVAGSAEDHDESSVFDEDGVGEPLAASSASVEIPDDAVVAKWSTFAPLAAPPSTNAHAAARRRIKKWSGGESSPFSLPRPDLCLFDSFDAYRKSSKASWDSASAIASASGAAGHAVLTAASGLASIRAFLESHITDADSEAYWRPLIDGLSHCAAPLDDAASILASSFNRGITAVRKGVVAASPASIRPLLESLPPKDDYFFGNPQQALTSAVHLQSLSAQLAQATAAASRRLPPAYPRRGSARPAALPRPAAPASSSSVASSTSGKGKASGRPARGGKGGPRK